MHISENNAFDGQQPVIITDGRKLISKDIAGKRFNLAISMFLIVFGVIIMILSMLMLKSSVNFIQTFCIAMFFISGRVLDIVQYGSDRVFCTGSSGKDIYGIYDILCSAAAVYILFQGQA